MGSLSLLCQALRLFLGRSRDVRPAAQSLSLVSPRESNQREGDPTVCVPFASLRGNLRCSRLAGSAQTRLRLKHARPLIRQPLRSSAHTEGTPGTRVNKAAAQPCPCVFSLSLWEREEDRAAQRLVLFLQAERSDGPTEVPSGCACDAALAGWQLCRVRQQLLRDLTRCSCSSAARSA